MNNQPLTEKNLEKKELILPKLNSNFKIKSNNIFKNMTNKNNTKKNKYLSPILSPPSSSVRIKNLFK